MNEIATAITLRLKKERENRDDFILDAFTAMKLGKITFRCGKYDAY
jgi:hypothetical protein